MTTQNSTLATQMTIFFYYTDIGKKRNDVGVFNINFQKGKIWLPVKTHHEGRNPQRVFSLPIQAASEWVLNSVL